MTAVQEQVVALINDAKLSTDKELIQSNLQQAFELVFNKDKSLLDEYYPIFLEFQTDKHGGVRKWLIGMIESVCKSSNNSQHLIPALEALWYLSTDESINVVKKIISTSTMLFPKWLEVFAQLDETRTKELWTRSIELRDKITALIHSDNNVVSMSAIKFTETVLRSYSDEKLRIPHVADHVIKNECDALLELLIDSLGTRLTPTNLVVLINALGTIAKQRTQFTERVSVALVEFHAQPNESVAKSHVKSIQHSLKVNLLHIAKVKGVPAGPWSERVQETLQSLGVRSAELSHHHVLPAVDVFSDAPSTGGNNKRKYAEIADAEDGPNKRARTSDEDRASATTAVNTLTQLLPPPVIVSLVIDTFQRNLAPFMPSRATQPANPNALLQFFNTLQPLRSLPRAPVTATSAHLVSVLSSLATQRRVTAETPVNETPAPRVVPATETKPSAEHAPSAVPAASQKVSLELTAPVLSAAELQRLAEGCFMRLIRTSSDVTHVTRRTAPKTRSSLLSFLATQREVDSAEVTALLDDIAAKFPASLNTTVTWLYFEYNNALTAQHVTGELSLTRYSQVLGRVLQSIVPRLDGKDKSVATLLTQLPHVTVECTQFIEQLAAQPHTLKLALSLLKDLTLLRPRARDQALQLLLRYAVHEDDTVRTLAIRLVSSKLFTVKELAPVIEKYASDQMQALVDKYPASQQQEVMTDIDDQTGPSSALSVQESEIKAQLSLYFALCSKRHELLQSLMQYYTHLSTPVRRIIHAQSQGLVKSIGMHSLHLLSLITKPVSGSELFLLYILNILTDNVAPSSQLVASVRDAYESTQDARFLIPVATGLDKAELLQHVPRLLVLSSSAVKSLIHKLVNAKPSPLTPAELLITLHLTDSTVVPLKRVIEAIQYCFEQKAVLKQEVLAVVFQQLMDVTPIPPLFMRSVIQTISRTKTIVPFILSNVLSRLIAKQIWNDKLLWEGFVRCCKMLLPQSVPVLLQLPAAQLKDSFSIAPEIKESINHYLKKNNKAAPSALVDVLA